MDVFTPYKNYFDQALRNLEKNLEQCIATILSLSNENFDMMMTKGVVLGHYISAIGI